MLELTVQYSTQLSNKKPPMDLLLDIKEAVQSFASFVSKWQRVLDKGQRYGFSEIELDMLARPYLRQLNLTKAQLHYITNMDKEKQRSKDNREKKQNNVPEDRTYVRPNDDKIDTEHNTVSDYKPKTEIPTQEEQGYINEVDKDNKLVMSTVKKDWNKVIEILQQEGFTFNSDPEVWTDTGIELSKEFSKDEYATKRYRILIEEILT